MKFVVISIIILLLIIILFKVTYGYTPIPLLISSDDSVDYFDFNKLNSSKSVCILAGIHGNEPAGSVTLIDLLNAKYFLNFSISIRIIPFINKYGLINNVRYQPNILYPDINRNFANNGLCPKSNKIIRLIETYKIIIDFHEGWGYHLINHTSVGSTISPGNTQLSVILANNAIIKINESI